MYPYVPLKTAQRSDALKNSPSVKFYSDFDDHFLQRSFIFDEVFKALPASKSHQKTLSLLHNILKFVSRLPVVIDKAVEVDDGHPD